MSVKEEKREVKVEQVGHARTVKATVSKDGATGEATGQKPEQAVSQAIEQAKEQSKATGGR